ncbi:MAG: hypothetical protein ACJAS7_000098 [Alpinimonas sp.]
MTQHPRIAEGVWLHSRQIKEFRNALIAGAHKLGVNGWVNNGVAHLGKAVTHEEIHLKRQTEKTREAELPSILFETEQDRVANAFSEPLFVDGQGADFTKILPHDMESAATNRGSLLVFNDAKLLNRFIHGDVFFAKQNALSD